ncbi:unnamed protein product [Moneuplotes crassus]|uniref:DOMON domain-containing protein n=1 Tax=Euplotes crassus TaxID=5936 RepID=A0AAD1Y8U2_EUPCR|nr:unnamed protein product [Moneuplotes crassus]
MIKFTNLLVLFAVLALKVANTANTAITQLNNNNINVTVTLISSSAIRWQITTSNSHWVAIGFGSSMTNTDMISIENSGTWAVKDRYSTSPTFPPEDTTNNVRNFAVTSSGSINTYTFERDLNTGDSQDHVIADGSTNMIYAYGFGAAFSSAHGAGMFGAFSISMNSATRDIAFGEGTIKVDTEQTLIHGLFMYIAWGWLSFFLIVTGRYSKYFYSFRTILHGFIGILALIFTLIGVVGYGEGGRTRQSLNSLGDEHTSIGGVVNLWTIITCITGSSIRVVGLLLKRYSFISFYLWYVHVMVGVLLVVYSQIAILSGLYLYDSPITYLFYIHLALMVIMLASLEVLWQLSKNWKYTNIDEIERKGLPEMTMEEVLNSKRKLAIFDQYVVDFGLYQYDHPGGKYVLDECEGKEIGKYFYGAYSLDDNMKAYKHSFVAGKIMKKLAIAKLKIPEDIKDMVTHSSDNKEIQIDHSHELYDKHFKVTQKEEIFKGVYRVTFSNDDNQYKVLIPGTNTFGRHYLVHSESQKVSRYYTICNTMNSEIYPVYINTIDRILGKSGDEKLAFEEISQISKNLQLLIKFYPQARNGLTKKLDNVQPDDEFIISKPLGSGLDLTPGNITGTNVVFLGGTGVLPFIDFFAYLARYLINEKSPSDSMLSQEKFEPYFKEAKFIIYVAYQTQTEAIGLEILTKISELFSHFGEQERFKLTTIFTREGGKKLDKQSIYDILKENSQLDYLKNVWVCGPPKMNNMFQRIRKDLRKLFDYLAVDII